MTTQATGNNMPLAGEMQLANFIQGMFSNKTANPNYKGEVRAPQMMSQVSSSDIQNLMTEYMRGQGGFLEKMQQQNMSGLYNTSTQKLMANDITAQAALKASQANLPINQANAQMTNEYYRQTAMQPAKYLPNNNRSSALGGLAIAGLGKLLGGKAEEALGGGKKKGTGSSSSSSSSSGESKDPLSAMIAGLGSIFGGGEETDASGGIPGAESYGFDPFAIPEFGFNQVTDNIGQIGETFSNVNLGGITDMDLSGLEMPDLSFDLPDIGSFEGFELPDFDWSFWD